MRQLMQQIEALQDTINTIEADTGLCTAEREFMLDVLYRDLQSARSALRSMERAA